VGDAGRIVVVGSGHAGFQVAASLRELGYVGPVALVGEESRLPYERPPLSKSYISGDVADEKLAFRAHSYYADNGVELFLGDPALEIDRAAGVVNLASGRGVPYDQLVLATGTRPRQLGVAGADLDGVVALRSAVDAADLRRRLESAASIVVVGGGFIGLEVAAVARRLGREVTVVEALPRLLARAVSGEVSEFYRDSHQAWGTEVQLGSAVEAIVGRDGRATAVLTTDGREIAADLVVVGIGVLPNDDLAKGSGLAVSDGVLVDEELRTSDPRISAIGDCARFPGSWSGRLERLESVQNAADQGRFVAKRLATGAEGPYRQTPWFWSDQGDLKLQIAGVTSGSDQVVLRGDPRSRSFSAFGFREGNLIGAESVNAPMDHLATRFLLGGTTPLSPEQAADPTVDLRELARGATKVAALTAEADS